MRRTYVFYWLFVVAAVVGAVTILGVAGGSDQGLLSSGEVFGFGAAGLALSAVGVWGARLCGGALRSFHYAERRALRLVSGGRDPEKIA